MRKSAQTITEATFIDTVLTETGPALPGREDFHVQTVADLFSAVHHTTARLLNPTHLPDTEMGDLVEQMCDQIEIAALRIAYATGNRTDMRRLRQFLFEASTNTTSHVLRNAPDPIW